MRELAKTFGDLLVWQKAHFIVFSAYYLLSDFPKKFS